MQRSDELEAWFAVVSAPGRSAIAVLEVWGRDSLGVVDLVFRPDRLGSWTVQGRLRLGRIGEGLGDEVIVGVWPGDDPRVEIQCHGGLEAVRLVESALSEVGAIRVRADDWVIRDSSSLLEAEARIDLAKAPTLRVAEILLVQSQGALERECRDWLDVEDFEESVQRLESLVDRGRWGVRLIDGWKVAIAGRPNVGKSQLLNALAGYPRAIVSPVPGTTRDIVTISASFDGWPVEVSDTAGVRSSTDNEIEAAGIGLAKLTHQTADLVVLLLDRSEPLTHEDEALIEALPQALKVANKVDLPPAWQPQETTLLISARDGQGVSELTKAIANRLTPWTSEPGAGLPFRLRHLEVLQTALDALKIKKDPVSARNWVRKLWCE